MTHLVVRRILQGALTATLAAAGTFGLTLGQAAVADDATAAWSASPADGAGAQDGRTRFELQADVSAAVTDRVLVANASTAEQTFAVYGADAYNTPAGGYDLRAAATAPTDVGLWVTTDTPTVTIAALSTAVVGFTVTVPEGASPGDHAGGVVVSLVNPTPTADGVLLDTRVAVRLNVRVPGELTPSLEVRAVHASATGSWLPFAPAPTEVSYEVANTGNVKIIGKPRIRVTGPLGLELATGVAVDTQEVLPGQSVTVRSLLDGVAPIGLVAAVVDVDMVAAPGPDTEIPLVSSTASSPFFVVSWTGLAVVLLVAALAWLLVRRARQRRRDGEELWRRLSAEADEADEAGQPVPALGQVAGRSAGRSAGRAIGPAGGPVLTVLAVLVLGSGLFVASAPAAHAAGRTAPLVGAVTPPAPVDDTITLTVPAPSSASSSSASSSGAGPSSGGTTGSSGRPRTASAPGSVVDPAIAPAATEPTGVDAVPVIATEPPAPDLVWSAANRKLSPTQWALVGLGGAGSAGALTLLGRNHLLARRGKGLIA
ncbi:DUF916 domain-containing protein [Pengzhenrongella frigida]|uniref:DUF916 domain-containing protein n=1 Tax=Pengzhenrongella frigida TaxID=1259133 RepID=A0A4Q5MYI9_9MICO|nr:DUF916 domain-containing protein [Cellulomonas sp. HLT2-17]RYV49983.1 DUF916 domain-containing protein [Cellulomonas sp. HLT2-17]